MRTERPATGPISPAECSTSRPTDRDATRADRSEKRTKSSRRSQLVTSLSVHFSNGFISVGAMFEIHKGETRRIGRQPNFVDRAVFAENTFDFSSRYVDGQIGHVKTITRFAVPRRRFRSSTAERQKKKTFFFDLDERETTYEDVDDIESER